MREIEEVRGTLICSEVMIDMKNGRELGLFVDCHLLAADEKGNDLDYFEYKRV